MEHTSADLQQLQEMYATQTTGMRATSLSVVDSRALYRNYLNFVREFASPPAQVLDVGCGAGWTTALFAADGYVATGLDLNPAGFEPPPSDRLTYVAGSGMALPFPDRQFDVVTTHQTLEHIPDPARMLDEMVRVCRPGGIVVVVGPNLVAFNPLLLGLTRYVWRSRPLRNILFRTPNMPRHPYGNTLPEVVASFFSTAWRIIRLTTSRRPLFLMRTPDLRPPFHSDNDACYRCTPLDLTRYFSRKGCYVLRDVALGRGGWTRVVSGGTWVAARLPAESTS